MKYLAHIIIAVVCILLIVSMSALQFSENKKQMPLREAQAELAQCLVDKDVIFYGAFWCPACAQQKALFGSAAKKMPYTECSTDDRQSQLPICVDEEVRTYPTWQFDDGLRCTGVRSRELLATLAGCSVPYDSAVDGSPFQYFMGIIADAVPGDLSDEVREGLPAQFTTVLQPIVEEQYGVPLDELTMEQARQIVINNAPNLLGCEIYPPVEREGVSVEDISVEEVPAEGAEAEAVPSVGE